MSSKVAGSIFAGVGFILIRHFLKPEGGYHTSGLNLLVFLGPASLICGCVVFIRGIIWGKRGFSQGTVRWCGWIMVVIGGFPWIYTPLIIPDRGMEGSGMLGTILFITVGVPGIAAIILSFFLTD